MNLRPARKRAIIAAGLLFAVLLTAGAAERGIREDEGEWVPVVREDLVIGVDVTGTLAAITSSVFGPPQIPDIWDYKISHLVPEGTEVKAGQAVLGFDTSQLQRELQEKLAEAESAKKQLEKTEADLLLNREADRLKLAEAEARLRKAAMKLDSPADVLATNDRQKALLEHDLAKRETRYLTARIATLERAAKRESELLRGRYMRAQQRVDEIKKNIAAMTIRAPRDGTIIHVSNWRNEKKKVGDSCWRGEKVLEIPDLTRMEGKGEVDEVDAGRIRLGQKATIRLDAHPDEEIVGNVDWIANTVQKQSPRRPLKILRVDLALKRTDPEKMRPGMRFRGQVQIEHVPNSVLVPIEAVVNTPQGPAVIRETLFGSDQTPVRLGKRNREQVQVLEGITAGAKVLVRSDQGEDEAGT